MPSPTRRDRLAVRGELYMRVMGWWMCFIVLLGLIVVAVSSGPLAALAVLAFWAVPGLWWGWRISHLGVFEESDVLVVRNPFRTYRIHYAKIVDIKVRKRYAPNRLIEPLVALFNRSVGVIDVKDRKKPIEMHTTEALWPVTRLLSRSRDQSATDVAMIRSVWLDRRASETNSR